MDDTTLPARLAARLTTPLLLLAAACLAMPLVAFPGGAAAPSGLRLAAGAAGVPDGTRVAAAVAVALLLAALALSLSHHRHRISLLVLTAGFAVVALLAVKATLGTAQQEAGDRLATSLGGPLAFGALSGPLQQLTEARWTAAYWVALLAAAAVFLLNSWALLRQPGPAPAPAAPALPSA